MQLGRSLYNHRGDVLLAFGTTLTSAFITSIRQRGYHFVYIMDGIADDVGERERLVADLGDHFSGFRIDRIDGDDAARRALTALNRIDFVAEVDRRVGREHLDLVDAETAEAVEHLFGQLIAFLDDQLGLFALQRQSRLLRLELGRLRIVRGAGQSDVFGDDRTEDLTLIDSRLALLDEVELAHRKEQAENL